jgi:hypothetical protein
MDKNYFIEQYRRPKITIWFCDDIFLQDHQITVDEEMIYPEELQNFFVVKYQKNGVFDSRGFEQQREDFNVRPVTVAQASLKPADWDLALGSRNMPSIESWNPIPVATDTASGRTLILDSNHSVVNIISSLVGKNSGAIFPLVRIQGANLQRILPDFEIVNRK